MLELKSTAAVSTLVATIRSVIANGRTVSGSYPDPKARIEGYLSWVPASIRMLNSQLSEADLSRLLATRTYWAALSTGSGEHATLWQLVDIELNSQLELLSNELVELESTAHRWGSQNAEIAVLDSNVVMSAINKLAEIHWSQTLSTWPDTPVILAIPMQVIDEVDNLKDRGPNKDAQTKARIALRTIEEWFTQPHNPHLVRPKHVENGDGTRPEVWARIWYDDLRHARLPVPDAEIVRRSLDLEPYGRNVTVITNDTSMLLRARGAGLQAKRPALEKMHVVP